jgi:hypothetical protein
LACPVGAPVAEVNAMAITQAATARHPIVRFTAAPLAMAPDLLEESLRVPGACQLGLMVRLLLGPFVTARIVGRLV